jgi:hypothetical protein
LSPKNRSSIFSRPILQNRARKRTYFSGGMNRATKRLQKYAQNGKMAKWQNGNAQ